MTPINAWDFGSAGSDEPGDQAALQAALDHAGEHGRDLYIPRGVYRITNALLVPSGVRVFGDGARTILRTAVAALPGATVNGGTSYAVIGAVAAEDVTIADLAIDLATCGTTSNGVGFIPDQQFTGTPCRRVAVERCHVRGAVGHAYMIWTFNAEGARIVDNHVDGGCVDFATFHDQNGIEVVGGTGAIVTGNAVRRCANFGIGAIALSGYVSGVAGALISGNVVDGCGTGVNLGTANDAATGPQHLRDVAVRGNVIRASHHYGVDVWTPVAGTAMRNVAVDGNVIDGGRIAVYLRGYRTDVGHRNVVVAGNVSDGAGATSGGEAAIAVTEFCGATVHGNAIADCAGVAVRVSFSDDVTIAGNAIAGAAGSGVAGTTSERLLVEGNRFTGCGSGTTYSVLVTAMTDAAIVRNTFTQAGPFSHVVATGARGRIEGNTSLASAASALGQNLTDDPRGTF